MQQRAISQVAILPPEEALTFLLRVMGVTLPQTKVEKADLSRSFQAEEYRPVNEVVEK